MYPIAGIAEPYYVEHSLFGRAALIVGEDYLSHPLWDAYLKFETAQNASREIVAILRKIIQDCPLKELDKYMARYVFLKYVLLSM